jgi:hypothetical protein
VAVSFEDDTLVSANVDNFYSCPICYEVVWDAKECGTCERLFCASCINTWKNKESSCPLCKVDELPAKKPAKAALAYLEKIKFSCGKCQQHFDYNQAVMHK